MRLKRNKERNKEQTTAFKSKGENAALNAFLDETDEEPSFAKGRDAYFLERVQPQGGISFKDDKYISTGCGYEACIHIYEYPQVLSDYWLANLCNIKDTVACIDISTEDVLEVKKNLNKSMKEQNSRFMQAKDYAQRYEAEQRLYEMQSLYEEISSMGEAIKLLQARIFVCDGSFTELEKKVTNIMATLESNGYRPTIFLNETKNEYKSMYQSYEEQQKELFPTNGQPMQSVTVAAGNPFHFSSLEDENGDFLGTTPCGGNVILDIFKRSATRAFYNSLCVGLMRSGKSTLLKKEMLARAIRGDFTRTFDITGEFTTLTNTLGGKILKMDGSAGLLNPLEILRSDETESLSFMRHISKVSAIYRFLRGSTDLGTSEMVDFEELVRGLYESFHITPKDEHGLHQVTGLPANAYPTFSDFLKYIEEQIKTLQNTEVSKMEEALVRNQMESYDKIRKVVKNIVINYGDVFDGHTTIDNISDEQIVTFDMSSIKEMKPEIFDAQIFNMVSFCWDNCVTNGKIMKEQYESGELPWEDVVRFLILIDEAHRWVNTSKPHVLDQILIYLREAPKYFGGIFLASQSIRDFVPEGSDNDAINKIKTIFGLTQYKFIFHQDMESVPIIESTFSGTLTRSQMDRISRLSTGENILSISSDSNLEFKVYLSDMENRLFTGGA